MGRWKGEPAPRSSPLTRRESPRFLVQSGSEVISRLSQATKHFRDYRDAKSPISTDIYQWYIRVFTDFLTCLLSQNQRNWIYHFAEQNSMVVEVLKPNVQELQKDVIALLEQISDLMHRASTDIGSDSTDNKYEKFQQEVAQEVDKVKNLELRMAIVAPMKAGKSTIINAIIGQDILPSRNAAMTTLPTEIVFNTELTEPTLTLSAEILLVFQDTHLALQDKIQQLGNQGLEEKIAQYPHLPAFLTNLSKFRIENG